MKTSSIVLIILAALLLMGGCSAVSGYNNMNALQKITDEKWAEVQSSYQRRSDLVPNLVATVKGAANFEQKTLTDVIEARAKATQMNVNASDLTPEKLRQFQQTQGQLSQSLGRLMVVSEQYPQLRATQAFSDLQTQLEGTENRIKVSRDAYNNAVQEFNTKISNFPQNLFASMFHFKEKPWFKADEGAQNSPKVDFGK